MQNSSTSAVCRALLKKEWIKLRRLCWLVFAVAGLILGDYVLTMRTVFAMHGTADVIIGLVLKPQIFFDGLRWAFPLAGIFLAALQILPESRQGRLRLALHLPASPLLVLSVPVLTGIGLILLSGGLTVAGFAALNTLLGFPAEVTVPMALSIVPWILAGIVGWCAAASAAADTSLIRRLSILVIGAGHITMLTGARSFNDMGQSVWLYAFSVVPWFAAYYQSATRIKAGMTAASLFARLSVVCLGIAVLSWLLPQTYLRATRPEHYSVQAYYSPVAHDFIVRESFAGRSQYLDSKENPVSPRTVRPLLPFMFRSDLIKQGRFPISIDGHRFDAVSAGRTNFMRLSAREVNTPLTAMTVLFDTHPHEASLRMPHELLCVEKAGLRFISVPGGETESTKTTAVTQALEDAGVTFPLRAFSTNPNLRKRFDDGAWLLDANGTLFRLRLISGKPDVMRYAENIGAGHAVLSTEEDENHETYGLLVLEDALLLMTVNDGLKPVPLTDYHAATDSVSLWTTPLSHTVTVSRFDRESPYQPLRVSAFDKTLTPLQTLTRPYPETKISAARLQRAVGLVSPLSVTQFRPTQPGMFFDIRINGLTSALAGNLLSLLIFLFLSRFVLNGRSAVRLSDFCRTHAVSLLLIGVFGLPALLSILAFGPLSFRRNRDR